MKKIGGSESDFSRKVAADRMGNVYVAGYFTSPTFDFNPGGSGGVLNNKGAYDVFIVKYDASGNFLWIKSIGGDEDEDVSGLAVDLMGNVFVSGYFHSATIDLNPNGSGGSITNAGGGAADAFLAKYDGDGNFLWVKGMGGTGSDVNNGVAVDNSGNAYVTGYSSSTDANFNRGGSGGTIGNAGASDVFLAKYAADGQFLWAKNFGGLANDYGQSIAVDGSANVYITGRHGNGADFNIGGGSGGVVNSNGLVDIFVAKYDTDGNFQWVNSAGGNNIDFPLSIAADAVGNVYFTGYSQSASLNFDPNGSAAGQTNKLGSHSGFLAAYDANGAFRWVKSIGGVPGYTQPMAVTVSGAGKVYVSGWFTVPVMDGDALGGSSGTTVPHPGATNTNALFLIEYEASGTFGWGKSIGGTTQSGGSALPPGVEGYSVGLDGMGNLYMAGWFKSAAVDFNNGGTGGELTSVIEDGFLVKYTCSDSSSSFISVSACGASYTLNDSVYTVSGIYTQHFYPNAAGCDSVVTLELELMPIEKPVINVEEFVLEITGDTEYASYQWIKENEIIPEATERTLTVTSNGDYRVAVTNEDGCADTSEAYGVTNYPTKIENAYVLQNQIHIHPNPATDVIHIQSPVRVNIMITDMAGKLIKQQVDAVSVPIMELAQGVYLLNISDENGVTLKVEKLVKSY